jgi:hypothetical protein
MPRPAGSGVFLFGEPNILGSRVIVKNVTGAGALRWATMGFLITALCSGCVPGNSAKVYAEQYDLGETPVINITLGAGQVEIYGTDRNQVEVSTALALPERSSYHSYLDNGRLTLVSSLAGTQPTNGARVIMMVLRVPARSVIQVDAPQAGVVLHGLVGKVDVRSSGWLRTFDLGGTVHLQSAYGSVSIFGGDGDLSVASNSGALQLNGPRGHVTASSIQGYVMYRGSPEAGDALSLASADGVVTVNLGQQASVEVDARDTLGATFCLAPPLKGTQKACTGRIGAGQGTLSARTADGQIVIRSES